MTFATENQISKTHPKECITNPDQVLYVETKGDMADLGLNGKIVGGEVKATWVRDGGLNSLLAAIWWVSVDGLKEVDLFAGLSAWWVRVVVGYVDNGGIYFWEIPYGLMAVSRLGSFWWVFLMYSIGGGMVAVGMNSFGWVYAEIGFWRFYSLWFCLSFFSELLMCPLTIGGVK